MMNRIKFILLYCMLSSIESVTWAQSLKETGLNNSVECTKIAEWLRTVKSSVVSIQLFVPGEPEGYCRVGSGFVYNREGWIVTRSSLVQDSDSVVVTFYDGRSSRAWIIHSDEMTEIALLKIPLSDLVAVSIGETSALNGESQLIVLGNSLGIFPSVTLGTYEGMRQDGMMQLRITVPPGNIGSPVFDHEGRIVGILAGRILEEKSQKMEVGVLGVALPIDRITEVIDNVLLHVEKGKGWIGLSVVDLDDMQFEKGLRVVGVVPGGPAEKAEICIGDTIVGFEGESVPNAKELAKKIRDIPMNHEIEFTIRKSDNNVFRSVQVGGIPWGNKSGPR